MNTTKQFNRTQEKIKSGLRLRRKKKDLDLVRQLCLKHGFTLEDLHLPNDLI